MNTTRDQKVPSVLRLPGPIDPAWLELIRKQVESLQFGVVQIVVHESRVVQVETTERIRLDR
jgi:hypothetical protein